MDENILYSPIPTERPQNAQNEIQKNTQQNSGTNLPNPTLAALSQPAEPGRVTPPSSSTSRSGRVESLLRRRRRRATRRSASGAPAEALICLRRRINGVGPVLVVEVE